MPIVRGAAGSARISSRRVRLPGGVELDISSVGVEAVLSWLAACAARKLVEELGVEPVEVRLEAYVDLDKLLDGVEEIEYLLIVAVYPEGSRLPEASEVTKAVLKCPVVSLFKEKIKGAIVETARG